jgi:alkyl hydroperoxide reductase subunit D
MSIEKIKNLLPDYAKDIRLNLASIMTADGASDLTKRQIDITALTVAYATRNDILIHAMKDEVNDRLSVAEINAAKSAATVMAMNNVYYRFVHLAKEKAFAAMPAKLRMNVIANSGIEKVDFELASLAVSALNGCGMCMDTHTHELVKAGISYLGIQSAVRIAAILNAVATGMAIQAA